MLVYVDLQEKKSRARISARAEIYLAASNFVWEIP